MTNNEATTGVVTRMQSLKSASATIQSNKCELDVNNNNEKTYKDRANNAAFCFESSSKFNYLNVENTASSNQSFQEQDNDQENNNPKLLLKSETASNIYSSKVPASSVLKPLNATDQKLKPNNQQQTTSHYYSHGNSGAIKRGCEDVDNENEDDLVTSISSSTGCSRRSPPKKPKFVVTSEEMNEYFNLIHQNEIQLFLKRDACCLISDKYALAMVFTYFKRAKFNLQEYTKDHFYLALYLASDIEEDVDEYKYEIFPWALGNSWRSKFSGFLRRRDALLRRIGYRAIVSRKCCEEVMSFKSEHFAWKRERAEDHGGATRAYLINRSKRFLLSKSNLEDDELNLPRLPEESARPCPLCLINRGWNSVSNSINLPDDKPKSSATAVNKSVVQTSYNKGYSLIKRQKSNDYSQERSRINTKPGDKATEVKLVKTPLKQKKKDFESNSETESELTTSNLESRRADSKMPAANKFLKVKLSTTELEQNHQESSCHPHSNNDLSSNTDNTNFSFVNLQRHSSLVSADKFLIKGTSDTSDEDSTSEVDDVFSAEKNNVVKNKMAKKQEFVKLSNTKLRANKIAQQSNGPNAIKRRTNYSMSNASNYNLRSHSVNRIQ